MYDVALVAGHSVGELGAAALAGVLSPESVSQVLFATALSLARNRGLVEPGAADLAERRRGFAEELRNVARRVDAVDALVAARHTGLID